MIKRIIYECIWVLIGSASYACIPMDRQIFITIGNKWRLSFSSNRKTSLLKYLFIKMLHFIIRMFSTNTGSMKFYTPCVMAFTWELRRYRLGTTAKWNSLWDADSIIWWTWPQNSVITQDIFLSEGYHESPKSSILASTRAISMSFSLLKI